MDSEMILLDSNLENLANEWFSAVAPHLQPFSFDETNSGDLIIVQCAVMKGDTPISLKWLFEGRHLEVGDDVKITSMGDRVSALTIPAVSGEHAGEYACIADNPAGHARHSAHLKVNGTLSKQCIPDSRNWVLILGFFIKVYCR